MEEEGVFLSIGEKKKKIVFFGGGGLKSRRGMETLPFASRRHLARRVPLQNEETRTERYPTLALF